PARLFALGLVHQQLRIHRGERHHHRDHGEEGEARARRLAQLHGRPDGLLGLVRPVQRDQQVAERHGCIRVRPGLLVRRAHQQHGAAALAHQRVRHAAEPGAAERAAAVRRHDDEVHAHFVRVPPDPGRDIILAVQQRGFRARAALLRLPRGPGQVPARSVPLVALVGLVVRRFTLEAVWRHLLEVAPRLLRPVHVHQMQHRVRAPRDLERGGQRMLREDRAVQWKEDGAVQRRLRSSLARVRETWWICPPRLPGRSPPVAVARTCAGKGHARGAGLVTPDARAGGQVAAAALPCRPARRPPASQANGAGIASCHALAPRYEDTDWRQVLDLYDVLEALNPTPVVRLNRAVAVAMVHGPARGLEELYGLENEPALRNYCLFPATIADLLLRAGEPQEAALHYRRALGLARTPPERLFLERRLRACRAAD